MISNPPWKTPLMYNCGKVGQSLKVFKPCLTESSLRISKNPNRTWCSLKMAINCLENPHCGAEGVPFMKSMIGAAVVNFSNLAFNCSGLSSTL